MNARKGLKRYGMRAWIIEGHKANIVIERERRGVFSIRRAEMPPAFFLQKFKLLRAARMVAAYYAVIEG